MTLVFLVIFGLFMINHCLSMVIPTRHLLPSTSTPSSLTHILRVRIRVHNSSIETLVNERQLHLIEVQLQTRDIPYRQIQDNQDGITIIIGPFQKSVNLTATTLIRNQTGFYTNFTTIIPIKTDSKDQKIILKKSPTHMKHVPLSVEAHEYNLLHDQESYEFRNCLELCEVSDQNELKPDHDCIRQKCLKEITGI